MLQNFRFTEWVLGSYKSLPSKALIPTFQKVVSAPLSAKIADKESINETYNPVQGLNGGVLKAGNRPPFIFSCKTANPSQILWQKECENKACLPRTFERKKPFFSLPSLPPLCIAGAGWDGGGKSCILCHGLRSMALLLLQFMTSTSLELIEFLICCESIKDRWGWGRSHPKKLSYHSWVWPLYLRKEEAGVLPKGNQFLHSLFQGGDFIDNEALHS